MKKSDGLTTIQGVETMTESEFTLRLGHEDECLDTTLANMRDHGLAHADTMWGEIRMVTDNDNQTVWIIRVDWPKLTKELDHD